MYVCMNVCMYVCMYVMYVMYVMYNSCHVCICICGHIHTYYICQYINKYIYKYYKYNKKICHVHLDLSFTFVTCDLVVCT